MGIATQYRAVRRELREIRRRHLQTQSMRLWSKACAMRKGWARALVMGLARDVMREARAIA